MGGLRTLGPIVFATLIGFAISVSAASANVIAHHGFQRQVDEADIVVVGSVTSIEDEQHSGIHFAIGVVTVSAVLKGSAAHQIRVVMSGDVAELDLPCLPLNAPYVFCLKRLSDGTYESVSAAYGVWSLNPNG
jgi:hypothetical protein